MFSIVIINIVYMAILNLYMYIHDMYMYKCVYLAVVDKPFYLLSQCLPLRMDCSHD